MSPAGPLVMASHALGSLSQLAPHSLQPLLLARVQCRRHPGGLADTSPEDHTPHSAGARALKPLRGPVVHVTMNTGWRVRARLLLSFCLHADLRPIISSPHPPRLDLFPPVSSGAFPNPQAVLSACLPASRDSRSASPHPSNKETQFTGLGCTPAGAGGLAWWREGRGESHQQTGMGHALPQPRLGSASSLMAHRPPGLLHQTLGF